MTMELALNRYEQEMNRDAKYKESQLKDFNDNINFE